ncbi:MAG TPA: siderophore-interacting protein [Streptosporangiaceae bacterium]|jgi:NADPH-dependent ferric siderophore reductase|nr:siderophore-interacting protein [Streptosporangiaceae bacterium]
MPQTENEGRAAAPPRRRPRPYAATVTEVAEVTPYLTRVTLGGDGLASFRWPGPGSHLKLFLPEPGQRDVEMPPADAEGFMISVPGRPRPTTRTFTPRRWDEATSQLDLEFVLHGHGPASQWALQAKPGDQIAVSQPRRTYELLPDTRWLLIAGDESALPAIATLLEAIRPDIRTEILVELEDADHQVTLPERASSTIRWLTRGQGEKPGAPLTAAVEAWNPPAQADQGPGQVWAACEALAVRDIRAHLLGPLGFSRDRIVTRGYWRAGEANHPDHDYGEDAV